MQTINRTAILVSFKEPYLEWAKNVDEDAADHADILQGETSVYLVESSEDGGVVITDYATEIFEHELIAWHRDEAVWPRKRDFLTFTKWFNFTIQPLIFDLEDEPIDAEPYD
jgi:hypothetical protein